MSTILIADDERNIRSSVSTTLRLDGFRAESVEDGRQVLERVEQGGIDLLLLDLQMPALDGLETLRELRSRGHRLPVIFLTAHGTIERAVEAVRLGAFDFIEKPPHADKILLSVRNALRQAVLEAENHDLRVEQAANFEMIGSSPVMQALYEQVRCAAPTEARVLILGENGSGKELIARALHANSLRAARPFVTVNCAAIPRDLFESELFGHERGAFTGATSRRRGKFVRADGGTLFLDEVAEIPQDLQAKLLRVLESGEVEPVGAERERRVDVRVLAATNRDLVRAVASGAFRPDLYYRLAVVTILAPPLRERREDIPALAQAFLRRACEDNHRTRTIDGQALARIAQHDFPGNVRELRNVMERLVILSPKDAIDLAAVEQALPSRTESGSARGSWRGNLKDTMVAFERRVLLDVLSSERWRMAATAERLGLERSHLYKKLKALGIDRQDQEDP